MKNLRKIFTVLAILWMAVIYVYSAQPGDESGETSLGAGMMFGRIFVPDFDDWTEERQIEYAKKIDHPVRKAAHFTEYTILGIFTASAYLSDKKRGYRRFLVPWIAGSLYAASDELHQRFVPGRNGNLKDVMLDSSGVAFGVCIVLLIAYIALRHKVKAYEADNTGRKNI